MTQSLALDSRSLAIELYRILRDMDPARWRDDLEAAARERISALAARMNRMLESVGDGSQDSDLPTRLHELRALLADRVPQPSPESKAALRARWMEYRAQLHTSYEALSKSLDAWSIHVPSLRPTNYTRNIFHVISALVGLVTIELVATTGPLVIIAASFALLAWSCETSRKVSARANEIMMWVFGKVAHPHERFRVNSATWYATALLVLSLTVPPMIAAVAVAILGIADPSAAIVGRRYGKTRLVNGRSLEGTLTFVATGFLLSTSILLLLHGDVRWTGALVIAACATVPAALAELLSKRIDDNLSIPLAAGAGGMAAMHLLNLVG